MTDIVIPYRRAFNDNALRFTLRSVEAYLIGVGNVFIVGDKPEWVREVIHLPAKDNPDMHFKERNIYRKLKLACEHPGVSDNFLMMNDDHYLLSHYEAIMFPNYYHGLLVDTYRGNDTPYRNTVYATMRLLGEWAQDYDSHCPMVINKERFKATFSGVDWARQWGYAIKSLYCGLNKLEGEYMADCKIRRPMAYVKLKEHLMERKWFSTDDRAMNKDMVTLLQGMFPEASKYEV